MIDCTGSKNGEHDACTYCNDKTNFLPLQLTKCRDTDELARYLTTVALSGPYAVGWGEFGTWWMHYPSIWVEG
jgi:hypothetical protein